MRLLMLPAISEVWVQGDDGQLVKLTNIVRFETTMEPGLALNTISAHVEFRGIEIAYVNSLPTKNKPTTDIRKRKMR